MQKFELEGTTYDYDGRLSVEDAMFIHEKSKVGVQRLNFELIGEGNPNVIAAFMFLLRKRAGEAVRWDDAKRWNIATFRQVVDDPTVLKAQKELLLGQLAIIDDMLAMHEDPGELPAEGEAADPPTPTTRGKTRRRVTGVTS